MQRNLIMMFSAICSGYQMFSAILYPTDGTFKFARQVSGDQLFRLQQRLAAKATTNIWSDHPNLTLLKIQEFGETVAN